MAVLTPQHISQLYDAYGDTEVTFNAQVILASGLIPSDLYLKMGELHVPCVLYACSMKGARVIAEMSQKLLDTLGKADNLASLRFGFRPRDERAPITFFISSRVESLTECHAAKPHVRFITLTFTRRPADALIGILGTLLELSANAMRRKDERIIITPESMKKIGLESRESCVAVAGTPRRCILRDLSFGGAKILMSKDGMTEDARKVLLKLAPCELKDDTVLDGSVVRVEGVEGRTDVVALSIKYSSEPPISYKQKINGFFAAQAGAR